MSGSGGGSGGFSAIENFTGKESATSDKDVTGKAREAWITDMKRALFSSGLAKEAWANKTLTFIKKLAAEIFEKRTPEETQKEGKEEEVFETLRVAYPTSPRAT